jgi:hypothetical protein
MDRLRSLQEANGGGLFGFMVGQLRRAEALQLLTATDRERLEGLAAFLRDQVGRESPLDRSDPLARIQAFHDEIVNDPESKPAAIGIASIALDSVTAALASDAQITGDVTTAMADVGGALAGITYGPLGMTWGAVGFSMLADSVHVHVSYDG